MGHIVNALQQFTGFSIALTKVSGRNLIDAAGVFARDPRKVTEQITQLSPFMMSRLNDRAMEFQSQVYKIPLLRTIVLRNKRESLIRRLRLRLNIFSLSMTS